jgi:hypothetical protein
MNAERKLSMSAYELMRKHSFHACTAGDVDDNKWYWVQRYPTSGVYFQVVTSLSNTAVEKGFIPFSGGIVMIKRSKTSAFYKSRKAAVRRLLKWLQKDMASLNPDKLHDLKLLKASLDALSKNTD